MEITFEHIPFAFFPVVCYVVRINIVPGGFSWSWVSQSPHFHSHGGCDDYWNHHCCSWGRERLGTMASRQLPGHLNADWWTEHHPERDPHVHVCQVAGWKLPESHMLNHPVPLTLGTNGQWKTNHSCCSNTLVSAGTLGSLCTSLSNNRVQCLGDLCWVHTVVCHLHYHLHDSQVCFHDARLSESMIKWAPNGPSLWLQILCWCCPKCSV